MLVVVAGIGLFCGSIYVLLGTNLGARLGFLVAFTGLMGFMVILSLLWCTTASPLNTIKGRIPQWKVQEVVSVAGEVQDRRGARHPEEGEPRRSHRGGEREGGGRRGARAEGSHAHRSRSGPHDNDFAIPAFTDVTKYMILNTYEVGGSNPQFWKLQFTHDPLYAVAKFCEVKAAPADRPSVLPPLPPECDPNGETGFVVLSRDLGSLRVPPFVAFCTFSILFVLGLLMLHWRERDEMEAEAKKQEPARSPNLVLLPFRQRCDHAATTPLRHPARPAARSPRCCCSRRPPARSSSSTRARRATAPAGSRSCSSP